MKTKTPLPGLDGQYLFLRSSLSREEVQRVLIVGFGCEEIAKEIAKEFGAKVDVIVPDYDSFISSQLKLEASDVVKVKTMDFENTDYDDDAFDLIYAQASLNVHRRNKIVKEIKRILKPGGYLLTGEFVYLKENPPLFASNVFEASEMEPLFDGRFRDYYEERKFETVKETDLSETLTEYYFLQKKLLEENIDKLTDSEKSYHKAMLKKINHESNVYLKLGGDKYYGFKALLLKMKS